MVGFATDTAGDKVVCMALLQILQVTRLFWVILLQILQVLVVLDESCTRCPSVLVVLDESCTRCPSVLVIFLPQRGMKNTKGHEEHDSPWLCGIHFLKAFDSNPLSPLCFLLAIDHDTKSVPICSKMILSRYLFVAK